MHVAFLSGNVASAMARSSSQWCRVATKMMVISFGSSRTLRSTAHSAAGFSLDRVTKNASLSVSDSLASDSRRIISQLSRRPARANCANARGIVAENSSVCRSEAMACSSDRSCSANPISKSLSASSKTAMRACASVSSDFGTSSNRCARRPGVAIIAAGRFASVLNCSSTDSPPTSEAWTILVGANLAMRCENLNVCSASSRVGESTMATTSPEMTCFAMMFSSIGIKNAAVLPDPVRAMQATSLPASASGSTCRCTGVGCL
mmetsp:Transcript_9260/g.32549  ORF Transcript_9260/g.32549 Transcript_9260/m.32549 type:complete len:263 (-) Transcript_9260:112-900(-)